MKSIRPDYNQIIYVTADSNNDFFPLRLIVARTLLKAANSVSFGRSVK